MKPFSLILYLYFIAVSAGAQVADFSMDAVPASRCAPVALVCTDLSTGNPSSWSWTVTGPQGPFTSGDQNPQFTLTEPGTYTVTLEIDGGADAVSMEFTAWQGPDAEFGLAPGYAPLGCTPHEVCFEDLSVQGDGPIVDWVWDLGVPPPQSGSDVCVMYVSEGYFDIELVVTDSHGCVDYESEEAMINTAGLDVDFVAQAPRSAECPSLTVQFEMIPPVDPASVDLIRWYFDAAGNASQFTDGTNSIQHTYTQSGPDDGYYNVALVIEYGCRRDSILKYHYIYVGQGPDGILTADANSTCIGDTSVLRLSEVTQTDSIIVDFGDGTVLYFGGDADSFSHVYSDTGLFEPVVMLISDSCGQESLMMPVPVTVSLCDTSVTDTTGQTTAITENELSRSLEIYPNPADASVHVSWHPEVTGDAEIRLTDSAGKTLLYDFPANGTSSAILPRIPKAPGVYFLQVISGTSVVTRKLVYY